MKKKETLVKAIPCLAIALLITSAIMFYLNCDFYGILLDVAIPLCIIAVFISLKQKKKNLKITPFLMLLMFAIGLGSLSNLAYADIYQGYGHVGWIYPDGEAWAMVDTDDYKLSFTWSFSWSCLLILAIMSMIAGEIHIARAKAFSILLISIVIVALVVLVVHHKLESNKAYEELHRSRVYEAYLDANDISRKIGWFTYKFYDEVYDLNRWLRSEASNGTKESIISAKCGFLRTYAELYWLDIRRDLSDLSRLAYLDKEIPFLNSSAFKTVHDAIREALGQVEWTTLGKTWEEVLNETPETLWELYYVLGVNQVEQEQPESGLLALDRCFSKLYSYWYSEATYGKGNMPHDATPPRIALEWAVGNATALHQELIQWDKYHSPLLPD